MDQATSISCKCDWCLPYTESLALTLGYCGFILYYTLGHVGGGNSCGGYTQMGVATTHAG